MKNTNNKYKLNFKTMKKGLLTLLAASLVFVGCQNYDDQFDDLNAQISALKSQVDGLSSLSGQVSSLSGTISGLQAGVNAAQAAAAAAASSADAATAAANAISPADLSGLEASLATLADEVEAVKASLATAATASAVTALQAELDAIESDLDDLLASSNIYSTDVTVTNATTLNSALALGNKLNVLNATLTINGYSGMDYTKVQQLADRVNTMTGNLVYKAASSTGTEVVFNNLVSAGDITMTQPGGYSFPKLANAGTINLKDDYETTVTTVSFPALTSATAIQTDANGSFEVIFTYATSVDFGALVTAPSNTVTITTKKDATLDLGSWLSQDASGNKVDATIKLNGPASFTNGTAAGTFASTGLGGNTLGAHDGSIELTNVATAAIHNFRGTITLKTGVKNFTGNNIVAANISAATDLETVNMTQIRDNDPSLSTADVANLDDSDDNTAQDVTVTSSHTKLTSLTVTGKTGDINVTEAPALTTIDLTGADAFNIDIDGNTALTSYTDASKAENFTFNNNDAMTSLNASHTTKLTATSDTGVSFAVTGNAEITSLTIGSDDVDDLDITSNAKLASLTATALKDNGTSTTAPVDIYDNAFVASLVKDSMESAATRAATGWAVGGSTDTGSITSSSGLSSLDAYLADALATTSSISVWFDSVTKLEIQSAYGGAYTDTTSSLPTAAFTRNASAATDLSSNYTGYLVYLWNVDANAGTTTGARASEVRTHVFDVGRELGTYADKPLAENEGIVIKYDGGTKTFKQGDSYNGSTVTTVDQLVAYMNADTALDAVGIDITADRAAFEKTLLTLNYTQSTGAAATAGTVSGADNKAIAYTTTSAENNDVLYITDSDVDNNDTVSNLRAGLQAALDASSEFNAANGTNSNQIVVNRTVSGGTVADRSPVAKNIDVNPHIDAGMVSTTALLIGNDVLTYGVTSNTAAIASSLFSYTVTETALSGIRVTLKNTGNLEFSSNVSLYGAAASNTAIITTNGAPDGYDSVLTAGVNAPSYAANNDMGAYTTTFAEVTSGTTTGAVTASLINRTGW